MCPASEHAHHDFAVMPGGRIAALAWNGSGIDPSSDLLIRLPHGTLAVALKVGEELHRSQTFHANAMH